jgi:L-2-hydroxycarboxylate dehydrogenase (NAD+)
VFKRITGSIMREVRVVKKAPGHDRIYIAGEKELDMAKRVKAHGVPVGEPLQKIMKGLASDLGLRGFDFPFL